MHINFLGGESMRTFLSFLLVMVFGLAFAHAPPTAYATPAQMDQICLQQIDAEGPFQYAVASEWPPSFKTTGFIPVVMEVKSSDIPIRTLSQYAIAPKSVKDLLFVNHSIDHRPGPVLLA